MKKSIRRSGARIMASLVMLLGSLAYIMVLAVINGSLGFVCAMGVTLFGAVGVAKVMGEAVALSYGWIIALAIGCGVLRGLLRYLEQYGNHYIAFRLLAVLRSRIFGALRTLCPAKLESKQKGSIIAMITSDIETLEVFYAHTISPICIAVIVSLAVFIFVGNIAHWYLALVALLGYAAVGIALPLISSARLKESGVRYRAEFAGFNAFFLDSIKGIKEIVLNNAGEIRKAEVDRRSDVLLEETRKMKKDITRAAAATAYGIPGDNRSAGGRSAPGRLRNALRRQNDHRSDGGVRVIRTGHCDFRPPGESHADLCERRQSAEPALRKACGGACGERRGIHL